jgi:hypothetical protein
MNELRWYRYLSSTSEIVVPVSSCLFLRPIWDHLGTEYAKEVADNAVDALLTLAMERGCSIFDGVMETDMGSISLQDGIELMMEAKTFDDDGEDMVVGYHA